MWIESRKVASRLASSRCWLSKVSEKRVNLKSREAFQQRKLLVSVLKKELGEKVQQAFSTVVELELLFYEQERSAMNEDESQLKSRENELEVPTESDSESSSDSLSINSLTSSSSSSWNSSSTNSWNSSSSNPLNSSSTNPLNSSSSNSLSSHSDQSCDSNRSKLTAQFLCLYKRVHSLGASSVSNKHSIEIQ